MNGTRLLVFTQAIDTKDPVLGFFHGWLRAFAAKFPHIHAVGLRVGAHDVPANVQVYSLGKESGGNRLLYILRFYRLAWTLRREYDAVFVHMNPEYVVLGGIFWRLMGKRVYLWRNHWAPGIVTDIAVALSHKTFCTSKSSYVAKYRKNVLMPVGIDTDMFRPVPGMERKPRSILSLGRIAPSKNIHVMLEAFKILKSRGIDFTASMYGDALPKGAGYLEDQKRFVRENNLSDNVVFYPGVKNSETPAIYSVHEVFVNASASGMFDKTIFEAVACGCTSIACSEDYRQFAGDKLWFKAGDAHQLSDRIEQFLGSAGTNELREQVARDHSLGTLVGMLRREMHI